MKVEKDKQFIVFTFDNGQTVKYDLATQQTIGKRGNPVQTLQTQLRGYKVNEFIEDMKGTQFGGYLKWISENCYREPIETVSVLLEKVKEYGDLEAVYNCGLIENVSNVKEFKSFSAWRGSFYTKPGIKFSDIPKGFLKISRETGYKISKNNLESYNEYTDLFHQIVSFDHPAFQNKEFVLELLKEETYHRRYAGMIVGILIERYNCNSTSLLKYIGDLYRYEALNVSYILHTLLDEYSMLETIHGGTTFNKYQKNLMTRHQITFSLFNVIKKQYDEEAFKKNIDLDMEMDIEEYTFIVPKKTQDIKDEAIAMHNCLASYVDNVIHGDCSILFMRYKDDPTKPLIDMEIRNGMCVQEYRQSNTFVTERDLEVIKIWEEKYKKKRIDKARAV